MSKYYYDTQNTEIGYTHYCSYCGKELKGNTEYDEREIYRTWYHCDCEKAKAEKEMQDKVEKIEIKYRKLANNEIVKIKTEYKDFLKIEEEFIKDLKYQLELKILNNKYGILQN